MLTAEWLINFVDTLEAQKAFLEADIIEMYDGEKYIQIYGENGMARMRPHGTGPHEIKQETILVDSTKPEQIEHAKNAVQRAKSENE